ncbi:MAG: alanine racemase, partial [Holosporales bacterium]|nr:alanine racemase [Holosporales bacterium]
MLKNSSEHGLSLLPAHTLSAIQIDLTHVQHNYRVLQQFLKDSGSMQTRCGGVVKANAYGVGAIPVVKTLYEVGCRDFFVADCDEALRIRSYVPEGRIFVFSGLMAHTAPLFIENDFIPTLLHKEQVLYWQREAQRLKRK